MNYVKYKNKKDTTQKRIVVHYFNFSTLIYNFWSAITTQIHNVNTKRLQILHHNNIIDFL